MSSKFKLCTRGNARISSIFGDNQIIWTIHSIVILDKSISESSVQIVIAVLSAYVVCFLMLEILRRVYKHQREKLDDVEEEGKG